jgi:hypothetical protein
MTGCNQVSSGVFVDSAYMPTSRTERAEVYHKKGVQQAQEKYYGGRQMDQELRQQFAIKRSKSALLTPSAQTQQPSSSQSRAVLEPVAARHWDQSKSTIKDIVEYQHAGEYRMTKVAAKCTDEREENRRFKYSELHDCDYRKNRQSVR